METQQKTITKPRKISRYEFDQLFPNRPLLEASTGDLVEWFANADNDVLGAIDQEPKPKTLAELQELYDKLVVELAVLQERIDALKAAHRKSEREKK